MQSTKSMVDALCESMQSAGDLMAPRVVTGSPSSGSTTSGSTSPPDHGTAAALSMAQLLRAKRMGSQVVATNNAFKDSLRNWLTRITPKILGHFKKWEVKTLSFFLSLSTITITTYFAELEPL